MAGESFIHFGINGRIYPHRCLVVKDLNHDLVIGRDFMTRYNVVLSFKDGFCSIGNQKIPLAKQGDIRSIVRTIKSVTIPPRTLITVYGRYHKDAPIEANGSSLQWEQHPTCFLSREPGLMVMNGLGGVNANRRIPVTIVNSTGRCFRVKKGNVLAKISSVIEINQVSQDTPEVIKSESSFAYKQQILPEVPEGLSTQQSHALQALLQKNNDVFAKNEFDIGKSNILKAHLDTGKSKPVRRKPYRSPMVYRNEIKRQIDEMMQAKLISPSNSSWAAPILCVKKKSGEVRICVDYRALNKVTAEFYWPLPNIQDVFCNLGGARYFSSLDFIKGYHQVEMDDESRPKTAFVCEHGLFQYNVLPFGLAVAPSIYQQTMTHLLNGLNSFCLPYLDDIIIWSNSFEEHLSH
jgi:hypothetical protein